MPHRFVSQFGDQESVNDVYVVSEKQLRPNRSGNLYLQMQLGDRTGSISGRMWNATEETYRSFDNGDYLRVTGATQVYQGALQMIVTRLERAAEYEVEPGDYSRLTSADVDRLGRRIAEMLLGIEDESLRCVAECYLADDDFMERFAQAPAGIKHHHAYQGGLLEHTVHLMELAAVVAPLYPDVHPELLLLGAFLHDLGKVDELGADRQLHYTDAGQLLGHVVLGASLLDQKIAAAEEMLDDPFPVELALRLKHMVLSHQGEYEFGSPKLPMTMEAVALHMLDNLDAKLTGWGQLISEDVNIDSNWTPYFPNLGRKLFKPSMAKTSAGAATKPDTAEEAAAEDEIASGAAANNGAS